jgi:uncharacterized protein YbjT (DUF2867 family)
MILIVGGGGVLGSLVVGRLLAAGERVRVMSRTPAIAESLRVAGAEVVQGDLLDRDSLVRACAGADAVVAAAHSMLGRGRHASVHVDGHGHRQLFDVAKAAGVRHIVYTSVYDYGEAYRPVTFFRIKMEVERYLQTSGIDYTILRPTAFMEYHAHVLIGEPVLAGRTVVLFGRGEQPRNFVAADDVAQVVNIALRDRSLAGATIDVAGPQCQPVGTTSPSGSSGSTRLGAPPESRAAVGSNDAARLMSGALLASVLLVIRFGEVCGSVVRWRRAVA